MIVATGYMKGYTDIVTFTAIFAKYYNLFRNSRSILRCRSLVPCRYVPVVRLQ